jgi:uncharacterized protein YjbI with pentapeptide repeats/predicted nucleic acid-binding protein
MIRVLLDIDILLDILLDRNPFAEEAYTLWEIIESKWIEAYVTPTTIEKIFCIAKKRQGSEIARKAIAAILVVVKICSVNDKDFQKLTSLNLENLEDAVQIVCAINLKLDAILTRNRQAFDLTIIQNSKNFAETALPILTAREFLAGLRSSHQLLASIAEEQTVNNLLSQDGIIQENLDVGIHAPAQPIEVNLNRLIPPKVTSYCTNADELLNLYSAGERNFSRVNLSGISLSGANLCDANIDWANLHEAKLDRVNLRRANLCGTDLSRAILDWGNLKEAKLDKASLHGANLRHVDLSGADLAEANLRWADLSYANLSRSNLRGADLSKAILTGADLNGADLSGADFNGANLKGLFLGNIDLSGANFCGANLSRADLSGADLSMADLSNADLTSANLSMADLSCADLSSAEVFMADLSSADLTGANLSWTDLGNANIIGADLSDDILSENWRESYTVILEQADLADLSEEDLEKLSERADEYEMYESEQVERAEAEERYWSDLIENFTQQAEEYNASSTQ